MPTDWSDSAVEFAAGFLDNDSGEIFEASAQVRTLGRTMQILSQHVESKGESANPEILRLLRLLLEQVEEQRLIDASHVLLKAVDRSRSAVNA